jgi:hypothetical protein
MPNQKSYKELMAHESVLPEDFTGVFYFTNTDDEDFVGVWGKKEYVFPAKSTSPMIIPEHSPIEIQNIRKKFAKDLAEKLYFKSKNYEFIRSREGKRNKLGMIEPTGQGMSHAGTYNLDTLAPYIQKCLEPLELKSAKVTLKTGVKMEERVARDDKTGKPVTAAVGSDADLSGISSA